MVEHSPDAGASSSLRTPALREVVDVIEAMYPPARAQSWDRVGLVVGDPDAPVRRIHLAVDPTLAVIDEAADADLLLTHHPLLLRGVHSVATSTAKGASVTRLVRQGTALYCAHTSADSAEPGVSHALADTLGIAHDRPLAHDEGRPVGRAGELPEPMTLAAFAAHVAAALPTAPGGIRYAGDPGRVIHRVGVAGGAGDTFFAAARTAGVDVFVTADLRHHPALEDLESSAVGGGPALVDAGHYATEWPWLPVAAERLGAELAARGARVDLTVSTLCTDPWTGIVLPG